MNKALAMLMTIAALAALEVGKADTTAAEWTKFRGDLQNTGYSPDRVAEKLELRWETELPGAREFWSSPCIAGGKLFVGNQDGCLYCLDAATGRLVWTSAIGSQYPIYASPAVDGGMVFCASYRTISALPVEDPDGDGHINLAEVAWEYVVGPSTGGVNDVVAGSPAIKDGRLYLGAVDQYFYCFDATKGGEPVWDTYTMYRGQHAFASSPAMADGKVFAATGEQRGAGRLYCFDEADGKILWAFDNHDMTFSSPAIADGKIFIANSGDWIQGNRDHRLFCLDVDGFLDGVDDGEPDEHTGGSDLIWTYDMGDYVFSSPACHAGRVFVGCTSGILVCIDAESGRRVWELNTGEQRGRMYPRGIMGSPAVADGKVFIGTGDGRLLAVPVEDPNGDGVIDEDEILWSHSVGRRVVCSPAIADGCVYIGNDRGTLFCFGPSDRTDRADGSSE
ncbi:MAG: PQQ-binding-like beta-propeller repeat protein [Thermoguttaceae bacterium]